MKKIAFILSMAFFLNANCQDMAKKIQSKKWFMTGNILKPEGTVLFSLEKSPISDTEVTFSTDGKAHLIEDRNKTVDVVCAYELKKDMIKIRYTTSGTPAVHYYKIKETAIAIQLEFVPIKAIDFK